MFDNLQSILVWLDKKPYNLVKEGFSYWLDRYTVEAMTNFKSLSESEADKLYASIPDDWTMDQIKNFMNGKPVS